MNDFFLNTEELEKKRFDPILIRVAEFINKYEESGDKQIRYDILRLLNLYRDARVSEDSNASLAILRQDKDIINENNLLHKKKYLVSTLTTSCDFYEKIDNALSLIGICVEGMIKFHYKEIYQLLVLKNKSKILSDKQLADIRLGVLNDYLLIKCGSELKHLFQTSPPLEYRLSDWRNMILHKNYLVQGDRVIVTFSAGKTEAKFNLSFEDVIKYYAEINRIATVLQIVRTLFLSEEVLILSEDTANYAFEQEKNNPQIKNELLIKDFEIVLASLKIDVEAYIETEANTRIIVKSMLKKTNHVEVLVYLIPLLYKAWEISRKKKIQILYKEKDGEKICLLEADNLICAEVEQKKDLDIIRENYSVKFYK